jgi:hypothetical protein
MRRREFITLLGGAAAWPLAAGAQQPKMRRVGALILGNADALSFGTELREGMRKSGYVEGQNIEYVFRSADKQHCPVAQARG